MQALRLVVAEDSVLLREGLVSLLERFGHTVVAAVGDAPSLIGAVREHRPDVVIVDVRMPPDNTDDGLRAAHRLRADDPRLPVLVLSQYVSQGYTSELIASSDRGRAWGTCSRTGSARYGSSSPPSRTWRRAARWSTRRSSAGC